MVSGSLHISYCCLQFVQTIMYDSFHWKYYTPDILQTQKLKFLTTNSIHIELKSQFECVPRDTEESKFLDLVDFGDVAFSVETVICLSCWPPWYVVTLNSTYVDVNLIMICRENAAHHFVILVDFSNRNHFITMNCCPFKIKELRTSMPQVLQRAQHARWRLQDAEETQERDKPTRANNVETPTKIFKSSFAKKNLNYDSEISLGCLFSISSQQKNYSQRMEGKNAVGASRSWAISCCMIGAYLWRRSPSMYCCFTTARCEPQGRGFPIFLFLRKKKIACWRWQYFFVTKRQNNGGGGMSLLLSSESCPSASQIIDFCKF